jgi:S-adenosylmethionine synthetase
MLNYVSVQNDYTDPSTHPFEVVENKGPGHPDSLADALSNEASTAYARWCLAELGLVPHHNLDKLFMGGGRFLPRFGGYDRVTPMRVITNGRISSVFGDTVIPYREIITGAVTNYLGRVLPHSGPDDVVMDVNATQNTRKPNWFTPQSIADIPDATEPRANDTSVCVAHYGRTPVEELVAELSRYFWTNVDGFAVPRFQDIGQDIKVLAVRTGTSVDVSVSMPTISTFTASRDDYRAKVAYHQDQLRRIGGRYWEYGLEISINVNPNDAVYMLGIGTCAECGEEGLVGRGNTINGLITSHRTHTAESWAGKNPVYFTGRVMGYLSLVLAREIGSELDARCSVTIFTRCGDSLIPPRSIQVSLDRAANRPTIDKIIERVLFDGSYLEKILDFRPWVSVL